MADYLYLINLALGVIQDMTLFQIQSERVVLGERFITYLNGLTYHTILLKTNKRKKSNASDRYC